ATVDLRGLGPQRTLVLVNGRRLGPGDANTGNPNPGADVNQIPAALIERIEVVTGGASATYGSDAVGGVVNFIMKKDFQGIQFDSSQNPDLCIAGAGPANEEHFTVVGNQRLPYPQASSSPPPIFNSSAFQTFSTRTTRYVGGVYAHYDINDWAKPYLEFNYIDDKSSIQIAPSGLFIGGDARSLDGASEFVPCNS